MNKRLRLSDSNKLISGVCGGIGEHFSIDPTFIRIIWVAVTIFLNIGAPVSVAIYLFCWAIIPSSNSNEF